MRVLIIRHGLTLSNTRDYQAGFAHPYDSDEVRRAYKDQLKRGQGPVDGRDQTTILGFCRLPASACAPPPPLCRSIWSMDGPRIAQSTLRPITARRSLASRDRDASLACGP